MSTPRTGAAQLARLIELGLTVRLLPPLLDVDTPAAAEQVAYAFPELAFSRTHARLVAARPEQECERLFDRAYARAGVAVNVGGGDRSALPLEVDRWSAEADEVDALVMARCQAPVLDLGCGPGRMVRGLTERGLAALGVDISSVAVAISLAGGGPALRRVAGPAAAGRRSVGDGAADGRQHRDRRRRTPAARSVPHPGGSRRAGALRGGS